MQQQRIYIAIDLKSFYASVECMERHLDPLDTNLVVADKSRTEKTICLAVSPSLKSYGIPGRARLFEVVQRIKEVNALRRPNFGKGEFTGKAFSDKALKEHTDWEVDYLVAPPRMALYMDYSARIYDIYLRYIAPEDMHVYSVDEVFLDVTHYLKTYNKTPRELAMTMILDVLHETGITATAGIGTNMYLCKIAMDIMAKHTEADENGVRIAELDEESYKKQLWGHKPLTDFWRVGAGYARKLAANGMYTMGDVARCSVYNEDFLYKLFGINAELLIDHAWGYEPCTIAEVQAYRPTNNSFSSGQVLTEPYDWAKTRVVVQEMADAVALDLVDKRMVTDQLVLTIGYDVENLLDSDRRRAYHGEITIDRYGRQVPKHAHGTANLGRYSSSSQLIMEKLLALYDRIADPTLLSRRITIATNHVIYEKDAKPQSESYEQLDLFTDFAALENQRKEEDEKLQKERQMQEAILSIKKKYGKNALLRGTNFREGSTARERNSQIGGHKA